MIAYSAVTPEGKTPYLFKEGYAPFEYKFILVDKEGRVRLSQEDIEKIVSLVVERLRSER